MRGRNTMAQNDDVLLTNKSEFMLSQLQPWSFQIKPGFRVRGWRTQWTGKPLIFFLHGNGFCALTYMPMLNALRDEFDLLLMDLPGHGESDVGSPFKPWNGSAKCAADVLQHFLPQLPQGTPVYGVGHSYGGVLTALMAGKHRDLFQKCVLLDPVLFTPKMLKLMKAADWVGLLESTKLAKTARKRNQHWDSHEAAYAALNGKGGFKGWREDALQAYVEHAIGESPFGVSLKCPSKIEAKIFGSYPKGLWHYVDNVQVPMQIMVASRSFPFISESAKALEGHRYISHVTVEGGHCFMQEVPEFAAGKIKEWLLQ